MALLQRVIQKIRQSSCLIIVIAPGWPGMPGFWDVVQLSTEIPLQLPVSATLLKQSHNYVFHSNSHHLNLHAWCLGGFSVEMAERIAAPQRSSTRTIYKSKWALLEKWCRENLVDFSGSLFPKAQTLTGYSPVLAGIVPKVSGIFQNGTFLLYLTSSQKHPLSL